MMQLSDGFGMEMGFPAAGMRVLAVVHNQTCLKLMENMLHQCHYNVTTTTQSNLALEMLRKHRNYFDLLICDGDMPNMSGFQLLQQVRLEMNLPVVMLSESSDKELVIKSILLGACDYLMKPIRIEELRNIWQHVVRKKVDCNDQNKSLNEEKICNVAGEATQGVMVSENNHVQHKILGQKRKQLSDDNRQEKNDESSSGKKSCRLVWTAELRRHFLAAVNQLGLENAKPKRIHELMNVEGLSRSHVASHLQKFKLGLKKQATAYMVPASDISAISSPCEADLSNFPATSSTSPVSDPLDILLWESIDFSSGEDEMQAKQATTYMVPASDSSAISSPCEADLSNFPATSSTSPFANPLDDPLWESIDFSLGEDEIPAKQATMVPASDLSAISSPCEADLSNFPGTSCTSPFAEPLEDLLWESTDFSLGEDEIPAKQATMVPASDLYAISSPCEADLPKFPEISSTSPFAEPLEDLLWESIDFSLGEDELLFN